MAPFSSLPPFLRVSRGKESFRDRVSVSLFCDPDPTLTTCADPGMPQFGIQNSSQGYQVMGSAKIGPPAPCPFRSLSASEGPGTLLGTALVGDATLGAGGEKGSPSWD